MYAYIYIYIYIGRLPVPWSPSIWGRHVSQVGAHSSWGWARSQEQPLLNFGTEQPVSRQQLQQLPD